MGRKTDNGSSDIISIKGDRSRWIDFVSHVKKRREKVWDVLSRFIDSYIKEEGRR